MEKKLGIIFNFFLLLFSAFLNNAVAKEYEGLKSVPQPTTCIESAFSRTGNNYWSIVSLKLTNRCNRTVNLQDSSVTFKNADYLNTPFWGDFGTLPYPDNNLRVTSQAICNGFLATLSLHFPASGLSTLENGKAITLIYGTDKPSYDSASVNVYLADPQPNLGEINLINNSAQPTGVSQNFAAVNVVNTNGQTIARSEVPWSSQLTVTGLAPATYTISPESVSDSQGNTYQGTAVPNSITLTAGQKASSTITYNQVVQFGRINVQVSRLPDQLAGYTNNPQITLTRSDTGAATTATAPWNATTPINNLANNVTYTFSTPVINFRNVQCTGTFTPASARSSAQSPPTTSLTYTCVGTQQDTVTINVSGLTGTTPAVDVTFTPNDGSAAVAKTINLINGQGTGTVNLNDGTVFNVSATSVSGFAANFNPQPLTTRPNVVETVSYVAQPPGTGSIKVQAPPMPSVLSGYPNCPLIVLTRRDTGEITTVSATWNTTTTINNLANNVTYTVSTPVIKFQTRQCTGTFNPASVISGATAPTTVLSYTCV